MEIPVISWLLDETFSALCSWYQQLPAPGQGLRMLCHGQPRAVIAAAEL